jgi:hypothetical protein
MLVQSATGSWFRVGIAVTRDSGSLAEQGIGPSKNRWHCSTGLLKCVPFFPSRLCTCSPRRTIDVNNLAAAPARLPTTLPARRRRRSDRAADLRQRAGSVQVGLRT